MHEITPLHSRMTRILFGSVLLAGLNLCNSGTVFGQIQAVEVASAEAVYNTQLIKEVVRQTISEYELAHDTPLSKTADFCNNCYCDRLTAWEAGAELMFLRPHFDLLANGAAIANVSVPPTSNMPAIEKGDLRVPEFDHEATYRLWLGWTHCSGWGARIRYWQFDHNTAPVVAEARARNDSVRSSLETALDIDVLDLESTTRMEIGKWSLLGSSGLRFLWASRGSEFSSSTEFSGTRTTTTGSGNVDFDGYGLTFALEAQRCTPWWWRPYATVRTSVIGGENSTIGRLQEFDDAGTLTADRSGTGQSENGVVIIEWQTGVEYSRWVGCREFFFRAGLEAQYWISAGRALAGVNLATSETFGFATAVPEGSVTFVGFGVSGGLRW